MERRHVVTLLVTGLIALAANSSQASGAPFSRSGPPGEETVAAERGAFSVILEFKGSFDAPDAIEIAYRPQVYKGELEIVEAAPPGVVAKGQCLVKFLTDKIDEQIEQAELDLKIARTNLERLTEETKHKEEARAIDLENAEMKYENARQTLETFKTVRMPLRIAEAEQRLQASRDRLDDEEAQFVQLQKMYKSDDLVEETEEIVLARARRGLEQSRVRMDFSELHHELLTTVDLPRELEGHEFNLRKATNERELARATSQLLLEQSSSELEKAEFALERQEREFNKLLADRAALSIDAPETGTAVPGQFAKGKWTKLNDRLRRGDKVSANEVFFTLVKPGPRVVRMTVPESSVLDIREGQTATIVPSAIPNATLSGKVVRVARVSADGQFDTWLELSEPDSRLIAGNSCSVKLKTSEIGNAVTVPASAVSKDGGRGVVHVWKNGETDAREVEVGATSQGRTVIVSGLEAGERVLRQQPTDKTP